MSSDINRMSVSEIVRKVEMVISLLRVNEFSSGEGIFKCYWFDGCEVFVKSVSEDKVDLMLFLYNQYSESELDEYVKVSLPCYFFYANSEREILNYLKELDHSEIRKEVESDLNMLACNISTHKDFAAEALKRIDQGKNINSYEYKQSIVNDFIDQYVKERLCLEDEE